MVFSCSYPSRRQSPRFCNCCHLITNSHGIHISLALWCYMVGCLHRQLEYHRWRRSLNCWIPLLGRQGFRKNSPLVSFTSYNFCPICPPVFLEFSLNAAILTKCWVVTYKNYNNLILQIIFFDNISFHQTMVHQCTCKNTRKCIPYWISCKFIWGSSILRDSLSSMWCISWQCCVHAPLVLQSWLWYGSSHVH
jgi:hypothetical protein